MLALNTLKVFSKQEYGDDYMEIKTNESVSFETRNNRKKLKLTDILMGVLLIYMVVVTVIFSYGFYENLKLHIICSDVTSLHSTSSGIKSDEYNKLVDKIDNEGYILSYAIEKDSKVISEKSGKISSTVPLNNEELLILTFTPKLNDNSTSFIILKEHLYTTIKH